MLAELAEETSPKGAQGDGEKRGRTEWAEGEREKDREKSAGEKEGDERSKEEKRGAGGMLTDGATCTGPGSGVTHSCLSLGVGDTGALRSGIWRMEISSRTQSTPPHTHPNPSGEGLWTSVIRPNGSRTRIPTGANCLQLR